MVLDVEAQQDVVEKEMIVYEHFGTKQSMKSQDMNNNSKA